MTNGKMSSKIYTTSSYIPRIVAEWAIDELGPSVALPARKKAIDLTPIRFLNDR